MPLSFQFFFTPAGELLGKMVVGEVVSVHFGLDLCINLEVCVGRDRPIFLSSAARRDPPELIPSKP